MPSSPESFGDATTTWQIDLFDSHCHPTDIMASIKDIERMRAKVITIMASRSQDQELVAKVAAEYPVPSKGSYDNHNSCYVIPAFGWHPWFSYQIYDDRGQASDMIPDPKDHYRRVLIPEPEDEQFLNSLPQPRPLSELVKSALTGRSDFRWVVSKPPILLLPVLSWNKKSNSTRLAQGKEDRFRLIE